MTTTLLASIISLLCKDVPLKDKQQCWDVYVNCAIGYNGEININSCGNTVRKEK